MTQSIPFSSGDTARTQIDSSEDVTRHKRLMELVEAEDAANGEVGCVRDWEDKLSGQLITCGINISDENLRTLLRENLGHLLMERDFDSITSQVRRFVESLVVQANTQSELQLKPPVTTEQVIEHIPTEELRQFFQAELGELFAQTSVEQIIQFTHYCVHKAVLHPRHTWPKPLYVLTVVSVFKLTIENPVNLEPGSIRNSKSLLTGTLTLCWSIIVKGYNLIFFALPSRCSILAFPGLVGCSGVPFSSITKTELVIISDFSHPFGV